MNLNIGLIGLGTIGSGVLEIIKSNADLIEKRSGIRPVIKKICEKNNDKAKELNIDESHITDDYKTIIDDPDIRVIVELIGGYEPARTIIMESLHAKKNVVTANKAVIAKHGKEIFAAAAINKVHLKYEASVGGCLPIIRTLTDSFQTDKTTAIYGILNGTTNFILTKMEEGMSYEEALKEAQALGFAEADPTFDVGGMDAAQKITILSRIAYNSMIGEEVSTFGISKIKKEDIDNAKDMGYKVKLLAISKLNNDELDIRVQPVMIPKSHELSSVNGELNAIFLNSEQTGKTMLYGAGAGKLPTATVVVSDIIDIAKKQEDKVNFFKTIKLKDQDELESRFYLRLMLVDKPGVVAKFAKVFGDNNISLHAINQKELEQDVVPVTIITHSAKQSDIKKAIKELENLDVVKEKPIYLMIEDFNK